MLVKEICFHKNILSILFVTFSPCKDKGEKAHLYDLVYGSDNTSDDSLILEIPWMKDILTFSFRSRLHSKHNILQ